MLDVTVEDEELMKRFSNNEDDHPQDVAGTFIPVMAKKLTEQETIRKTVQE